MWGMVSESIGEVAKSNKDSVGKADGLLQSEYHIGPARKGNADDADAARMNADSFDVDGQA